MTSIFRVTVHEGRGLGAPGPSGPGNELQALAVTASLAGEVKATPFSVGADAHRWGAALEWGLDARALRRQSISGGGAAPTHCKLSVERRDGRRLGWVVLDLRTAKMNAQYGRGEEGEQRGAARRRRFRSVLAAAHSLSRTGCSRTRSNPHRRVAAAYRRKTVGGAGAARVLQPRRRQPASGGGQRCRQCSRQRSGDA